MKSWNFNFIVYHLQIDEEILQEVVNMGFDRNLLLDSIQNRVQNEVSFVAISNSCFITNPSNISTVYQGTVTYYLLLDNRFRVSGGYLGSEFQETVVRFLSSTYDIALHSAIA